MVFKCQVDSCLTDFECRVVSCEKKKLSLKNESGKKETVEGYEVVCEDTILFPEGGGQPCDLGYMNDSKVLNVIRRGTDAVHFTEKELPVGEVVKQKIDKDRRLDHMQQHSGQHLITAILDRDYGYPTTSWWLGEDVSYIEIDTPTLTEQQLKETEKTVNDLIRQNLKVTVQVHAEGDETLDETRTRGLPKDHKGDVRVITIEGVDSNMCCGTHVSSLSQIQVIKLLYAEKGKRKNQTILYFLVGNRVLKRLDECLQREQKLTSVLKNNPSQHFDLVQKLQKNLKVANDNSSSLAKEIANDLANKLKKSEALKYFCHYQKAVDADFMHALLRSLEGIDIFLFLATGDEKGVGNILLKGDSAAVNELGPKICLLLDGKGAGKNNTYQARVNAMKNREACEKLIAEYFSE